MTKRNQADILRSFLDSRAKPNEQKPAPPPNLYRAGWLLPDEVVQRIADGELIVAVYEGDIPKDRIIDHPDHGKCKVLLNLSPTLQFILEPVK